MCYAVPHWLCSFTAIASTRCAPRIEAGDAAEKTTTSCLSEPSHSGRPRSAGDTLASLAAGAGFLELGGVLMDGDGPTGVIESGAIDRGVETSIVTSAASEPAERGAETSRVDEAD